MPKLMVMPTWVWDISLHWCFPSPFYSETASGESLWWQIIGTWTSHISLPSTAWPIDDCPLLVTTDGWRTTLNRYRCTWSLMPFYNIIKHNVDNRDVCCSSLDPLPKTNVSFTRQNRSKTTIICNYFINQSIQHVYLSIVNEIQC